MKRRVGFLLAAIFFWMASGFAQNLQIGWTEDFSSYSYYDQPTGWTVIQSATGGGYSYPNVVDHGPAGYGDSKALEFKFGSSMIALPSVAEGVSIQDLRLSFYYRVNNSNTGKLELGYVTDLTDTSTYVQLVELPIHRGDHNGAASYSPKWSYDLNEVPEDAYVVLKYTSTYSSTSWYLDNFSIEAIPDCPKISGTLAYTNVTDETATVTFSDSEDQSAWILYWRAVGSDEWTTVSLTDTSYTITNLTPSSKYEAYVTRDCGEDEVAEVSNTITFKTTAVLIEAPFEMTFESDEDATHIETRTSNNEAEWYIGTAENNTADAENGKAMYISKDDGATASFDRRSSYNSTGYSFAIIPIQFDDATEHAISFDYKCEGTWYSYGSNDNYEAKLRVYLVPAGDEIPESGSPTTGVQILEAFNQADWQNFVYTTTSVSNTTQQLVFIFRNGYYSNYGTTNNGVPPVIDNIKVTGSNCASPTDLSASNVQTTSLDITWIQAGELDGWRVYYREQGSSEEWNTQDVSGSEPLATINGLEGDHYYNIKVVGLCGEEETAPTNTITVHTACVAITDNPWETGFEDGYTLDCWEMVQQTNSTYSGDPFPKLQASNSSIAYDGDGSIEFKMYNGNNGPQVLAFPLFDYDLTTTRLQLKYRTNKTYSSYSAGTFEVGYVTDLTDATSFVAVEQLTETANGEWKDGEAYLTALPEGARLAFRYSNSGYNGGATSWYIDNLKILDQPNCTPITKNSVKGTEIGENSFTVTFEDLAESHTAWKVYYRPNGSEDEYQSISATDTAVEITGLSADTKYDVYVTVDCGDEESDPSYITTVKTACGTISTLPWQTDLEGADASACFTFVKITDQDSYADDFPKHQSLQASNCHSGTWIVEFRDGEGILAFPKYEAALNTLRLNMWVRTNNWSGSGANSMLVVGAMSDLDDESSFEALDTIKYEGSTSYFEYTKDLVGFQTVTEGWITIKHITTSANQNSWYLDDLKVSLIPQCPAPDKNSVTLVAKASNSLTVAFNDGNENHTSWKVFYQQEGEEEWNNVTTTDKDNTVISGLESNTNYNIYVITVCDGEDGDEPTNTVTFRTDCGPMSVSALPWTEGFESGTNHQAPLCWVRMQTADNGGYTFPNILTNSSAVRTGSNAMEFKGGDCMIAAPAFEGLDYHAMRLRFYHRYNNSSTLGHLYVGVVSDINDPSTFEQIAEVANHYGTGQSSFSDEEEISLAGYTTEGDVRIAFKYVSGVASASWYIDDITLDSLPACSAIIKSSVTAENVSDTSATIKFTDNDPTHTAWKVYYKQHGSEDDPQVVNATTTQAELQNLASNTQYDVYVTVDCGEDGESEQSKTLTFKTKASPVQTPYTQDFEEDSGAEQDFVFTMTDASYSWASNTPWVIGSAVNHGGERSMYVGSADANTIGTSYGSYSYAAVNVQFEDFAEYTIQFDVKSPGYNTSYGYMNVYLVDEVPESGFPTGVQPLNSSVLQGINDWTQVAYDVQNVANTQKILLFVWYNYYSCTPAAIDNLSITGHNCARPTELSAIDITDHTAKLNWRRNGENNWTLYYIETENASDLGATWYSVSANDTVVDLTGLTANTRYSAYVQAACGTESTILQFKTMASLITVPDGGLTIDFEDPVTNGSVALEGSSTNKWFVGTAATDDGENHAMYISDDENGATYNYSITSTSYAYAVIPVQFGDKEEYNISFDYKVMGQDYYDYLMVYLLDASQAIPTSGAPNGTVILDRQTSVSNWTTFSSDPIRDVKNTTKQIVFYWTNNAYTGTQPPAAIDNIVISGSDCAQPNNMAYSSVTDSSAVLSWKENGVAEKWVLHYKLLPSGADQTVNLTSSDVTVSDDNTVTYTLTGLFPGSKYSAYVNADCELALSNNSGATQFTTLGQIVNTFPFFLDFETPEQNGVFDYSGSGSNQWYIGPATGVNTSAGDDGGVSLHSLYISNDGGNTQAYTKSSYSNSFAVMNINFGDDAEYNLEFDYMAGGRLTTAFFAVYLVDADFNVSSLTSSGSAVNNRLMPLQFGVNDWTHASVKLPNVTNQSKKLVFRWYNTNSGVPPAPAVDNIRIEGSSCAKAVTNLRNEGKPQYTTIKLDWDDNNTNNVSQWKIYYRPKDNVLESFSEVTVDTTSYELGSGEEGDLLMGTIYDIKVAAICPDGGESIINYIQAATECEPQDNTGWSEGFDIAKYPINRSFPLCWTRLKESYNVEETGAYAHFPSIITFANTGYEFDATSMEFRGRQNTVATPYFASTTDEMVFSFYACKSGSTGTLDIYLASDVYDSTTWEPLMVGLGHNSTPQIPTTANGDNDIFRYGYFEIPLNNVINKGTDKAVVLKYENFTYDSMTSWYFDNFRVFVQDASSFDPVCENNAQISVNDANEITLSDGTVMQVSPNETSATISWTKEGAKHWDYKINLNGKFTKTSDTTATFNNLIPGTEYTAYVRTYCYDVNAVYNSDSTEIVSYDTVENGKVSAWNELRFMTDGDLPECPVITSLEAVEIGETTVKIQWTANSEADSLFEVIITDKETVQEHMATLLNENVTRVSAPTHEYTFTRVNNYTPLVNNTDYKVFVRSICKYNESDWTEIAVKTLKTYVAPVVENVSINGTAGVTSNSATLRGSVIANDEVFTSVGFNFVRSEGDTATYTMDVTANPSYEVTGLTPKTTYKFRTFAANDDTTFYASSWATFTTADPTKPVVRTLAAAAITAADSNSAIVNGEIIETDETITEKGFEYRLESATGSYTQFTAVNMLDDTSMQATLTGLQSNTTYIYRAYAKTASYTERGTEMSFTTAAGFADIVAPTIETKEATNVEITSATLNGQVTPMTEEITSAGFVYWSKPNKSDSVTVQVSGTGNISTNLTDLKEATNYMFYAWAQTENYWVKGEHKTFQTTESQATPYTVVTLAADFADIDSVKVTMKGQITVSGNKAITERGFMIVKSGNTDTIGVVASTVDEDIFSGTALNLVPETEYAYYAYVRTGSASTGNLTTYYGNVQTVTTKEGPKVYPEVTTLDVMNVTDVSATFNGLVKQGNVTITEQGFAYRVKDTENETTVAGTLSGETMTAYVSDLSDTTTYIVYAYARVTDGTVVRGEDKEFITLKTHIDTVAPTVTTGQAVADSVTATLYATVIKGTETLVKTGFTYRVKGTADWTNTVEASVDNTGSMNTKINGLTPETEYEYQAFVETESGKTFTGNVASFVTTKSGLADLDASVSIVTYPNPTTDNATLRVEGLTSDAQIIVTDIQGRQISVETLPQGQSTVKINSENLPAGVYYIKVISDGQSRTQKLIKR